jgi:hypothetical protein
MKQFPISNDEQARIEALVANLNRSLSALIEDIRGEERRIGVTDVSSPSYPMLARHLRARQENISGTITALRARLPEQTKANELA